MTPVNPMGEDEVLRLRTALEQARRDVETLAEVERELAETVGLLGALEAIARHARRLTASDLAYVAVLEAEPGVARVAANAGARSGELHDLVIDPRRGAGGRALQSRRPFRTEDCRVDPRLAGEVGRHELAEGVVGLLVVPMILEREPIGLLFIANRGSRAFTQDDENRLDRLALPAALAIRHARLVSVLDREGDLLGARSRELERSASQLRGIVEAARDAILTVDGSGRITSVNPATEMMFGYPAAELLEKDLHVIIPPPAGSGLREGGSPREELDGVRRDGSRFPIELSVSIVRTRDAHFLSVIVRDITERKAIDQMKDEFIATVSHELRTPLTAIKGHVELVLEGEAGPVTELQRQFLGVASQNTDRLGALINDLLDVERINAGGIDLRRDPVDVTAVLRDVVSTFRLEAERKGLVVREEIGELPRVMGDRDRLIQAFGNLVSNAVKYTVAGEIGVRAISTQGQAEVIVHDTGIGMTTEEQHRLFTRFYRSRAALVRDAGGTGLGLVIVKGIVGHHGGQVSVESQAGVGSRFRVVLPAAPALPAVLPPAAPGQRTVLVVEDEADIRELVLSHVRRLQCRGVGAANGSEALDLARRLTPDLIVLDVLIPPPDGWEVLTQLKADPATRDIPVVLHTVVEDRERAARLGAAGYLVKPAGSRHLRRTIRVVLERQPVPVLLLHPDPALGDRLRSELAGAACVVRQALALAEARPLRPTPPAVVVVHRTLADGSAEALVRDWRRDPAFRDVVLILSGEWPDEPAPVAANAANAAGKPARVRGRRVSDLARQIRTAIDIARRGGEPR